MQGKGGEDLEQKSRQVKVGKNSRGRATNEERGTDNAITSNSKILLSQGFLRTDFGLLYIKLITVDLYNSMLSEILGVVSLVFNGIVGLHFFFIVI